MDKLEEYKKHEPGSDELVNMLVEEHMGWATSIAKSVARAWNLDWQLDGLDGGAFEALLFCARRYDPARGVPFRGYARRRIHEASTQEARDSKSWQRGTGAATEADQEARELSAKLFDIFPELREGLLPANKESGETVSIRSSIRQLLAGASMIAAFEQSGAANPEVATEYKRLLEKLSDLEAIHQEIIWAVYYKGQSMRSLADEWEVDDLSVIREHQVILGHLCGVLEGTNKNKPLKIRRGLRTHAQAMRKKSEPGPFSKVLEAAIVIFIIAIEKFFSGGIY